MRSPSHTWIRFSKILFVSGTAFFCRRHRVGLRTRFDSFPRFPFPPLLGSDVVYLSCTRVYERLRLASSKVGNCSPSFPPFFDVCVLSSSSDCLITNRAAAPLFIPLVPRPFSPSFRNSRLRCLFRTAQVSLAVLNLSESRPHSFSLSLFLRTHR